MPKVSLKHFLLSRYSLLCALSWFLTLTTARRTDGEAASHTNSCSKRRNNVCTTSTGSMSKYSLINRHTPSPVTALTTGHGSASSRYKRSAAAIINRKGLALSTKQTAAIASQWHQNADRIQLTPNTFILWSKVYSIASYPLNLYYCKSVLACRHIHFLSFTHTATPLVTSINEPALSQTASAALSPPPLQWSLDSAMGKHLTADWHC